MFAVGCECGWRSERFHAPLGTRYMPHIVLTAHDVEEEARELWCHHVEHSPLGPRLRHLRACPDARPRLREPGHAPGGVSVAREAREVSPRAGAPSAALAVEAYMARGELVEAKAPLVQSAPGRSGALNGRRFSERAALAMVKRRAAAAGLPATLCNHSFRGTGITLHQDAGGDLEAVRQIAGHASVKTTQLYNRSGDKRRRSEVERVQL